MNKYLKPVLLTALALTVLATAPDFSGKVVAITDGDTLTVLHNNTQVKIRLHGIDCPEKGQPFGTKAKQFTSELAFGKVVNFLNFGTDQYGRAVGVVILPDGKNLNQELVRAGFAWWYRKYAPDVKELEKLETEAREAKRGLWVDPDPVPPWEWRQGKRSNKPEPEVQEQDITVYITDTGKKYHRDGCRYLKKSKHAISLKEARERGYEPCKVCKPLSVAESKNGTEYLTIIKERYTTHPKQSVRETEEYYQIALEMGFISISEYNQIANELGFKPMSEGEYFAIRDAESEKKRVRAQILLNSVGIIVALLYFAILYIASKKLKTSEGVKRLSIFIGILSAIVWVLACFIFLDIPEKPLWNEYIYIPRLIVLVAGAFLSYGIGWMIIRGIDWVIRGFKQES
jgi:endonuclease YncB( thermonuclease family)/methylphosphotriester-DNA--protein-cysteine methyltransferase